MFENGGGIKGEYRWTVGSNLCCLKNGVMEVAYLAAIVQSGLAKDCQIILKN